MALRLRKLSYALGAEVCDIDLTQPLGDDCVGDIRRAFLEHNGLLLFRNQRIGPAQHIAFSRRFGELDRHESVPRDRHPEHAEILVVSNEPDAEGEPSNSRYTGQLWHSDLGFTLRPALGSLLRAAAVPSVGGDTLFANMVAAHDALSAGMQALVADLCGIHTQQRRHVSADWQAESSRLNPPVAHPLVRIHPETGRKALYVGEPVKRIEGLSDAESAPILEVLLAAATRPQVGYRHQWQVNDLVFWDNRCTNHQALGDYDPAERRRMERTTLVGEPSGHPARIT